MSDQSQSIVDIEVGKSGAKALGRRVCKLLQERGIIGAPKTGCLLSDEPGYPPGKKYADACAERADRSFMRLLTMAWHSR